MTEYEKEAMDYLRGRLIEANDETIEDTAMNLQAAELILRYENHRTCAQGAITFENRTKESEG